MQIFEHATNWVVAIAAQMLVIGIVVTM